MRFGLPLIAVALAVPAALSGQNNHAESGVYSAVSIPLDLAVDSYQIYSQLIPLDPIPKKHDHASHWVVRDETISVVPKGQPCWSRAGSSDAKELDWTLNPHISVHPPGDQMGNFEEILADFDAHCHEQERLSAGLFHAQGVVQVLTPEEQDDFRASLNPGSTATAQFEGAPALYGFSQVYFNASRTVALVYATDSCGSVCGEGYWAAFGREGGRWKPLHWKSDGWAS